MSADDKPVEELGYEQARDELIDVVRVLEQGGLDLDASLALWERGEKLAKQCEHHLAGARRRIEKALSEDPDEAEGPEGTVNTAGARDTGGAEGGGDEARPAAPNGPPAGS